MERRAHTLDVVRLRREVDGKPAGTTGTVVLEDPEAALVEVVSEPVLDETGVPVDEYVDLLEVPYSELEIVQPARATTR